MPRGKNNRLKKAHQEMNYTPEQVRELQKCIADPIYFMRNYVYIKHPVKGQILFDLFDYQEEMVQNFQNKTNNICLLPRQVGKCIFSQSIINTRVPRVKLFLTFFRWWRKLMANNTDA